MAPAGSGDPISWTAHPAWPSPVVTVAVKNGFSEDLVRLPGFSFPAKKIVSKEYVDYSCPSLCGRPLAAMMNLTAASFSWRYDLFSRYKPYTCSAGRF
jgi:hypothetical protein